MSNVTRRDFIKIGAAGTALAAGLASTGVIGAPDQMNPVQSLRAEPLVPAQLELKGISKKTMEDHFKLYEGYVKKANEIMMELVKVDLTTANATYSQLRELKVELSFALGGVKNHAMYFGHLTGKGSQPAGKLLNLINRDFGSVAQFTADLKATAMAARGWAWTAFDKDLGRLVNFIGDSQNTYPVWNAVPIIALDVYEHAYFVDYGTKRADYIDAFLANLDWVIVDGYARKGGII